MPPRAKLRESLREITDNVKAFLTCSQVSWFELEDTVVSPVRATTDALNTNEQPPPGQLSNECLENTLSADKSQGTFTGRRIESAADILRFGPLSAVADALQGFADMYIMDETAKKEHQSLQQRLQVLLNALKERTDGEVSITVKSKIQGVHKFIQGELNSIAAKRSGRTHGRYLLAKEEEERFLACCHRVQMHMDGLLLNASISVWRIEEQQSKARMSSLVSSLQLAPSACYDSRAGEELKRRECTAGTRLDVLANLLRWTDAQNNSAGGVYWLNGMAGTGKTTIAYSVCQLLDNELRLAASFFCSRMREECRNPNMIIPSVAYQLARFSLPYQSALLTVLEREPDIHTKRLLIQFKALIEEPLLLAKPSLSEGMTVVIDALDECEDETSTRDILGLLLSNADGLPIRFLVSSRPEPQIRDQMTNEPVRSRLVLHELDTGRVQTDIETYLREELKPMKPSPTEAQIAALVERAGILFIYAATAVRYIGYDNFLHNPGARLRAVLGGTKRAQTKRHEEIDQLYMAIFEAAFTHQGLEKDELDNMRQVLNTVICAREPLTVTSLSNLLRIEDVECIRAALRPFWSVLHVVGANEVVTTLHASFPDFMFDSARSLTYCCDSSAHHRTLAELCLERIARTKPRFNICGLETSYRSDGEVPNLKEGVAESISSELLYACRYWADHVKAAKYESSIDNRLHDFLSKELLLWMEVLNLTNHMNAATACVKAIASWCQANKAQKELLELAYDARRFVEAFAASPVSQSTPHIYVSMLAFWPRSAPIAKHYVRNTPKPVEAEGTALGRRQLAHISTWDFKGHIWAMAVSADGLYLALAIETEVLLVDSTSGRTVLEPLQGHPKTVKSVAFLPGKPRVVAGSFGSEDDYATVLGWDTGTGNAVLGPIQLRGHTGSITCLRFSPDCSRIATGSTDKTARLWDIESGNMLDQLQAHDAVYATVFSADGNQLVAGANKTLHRWDTRTGEPVHTPITHTEDFDTITISPDQYHFISGSGRGRTIYVWNTLTGDMIRSIEGHTDVITCIASSPDGRYIVSGSSDRTVRVWDAQTGNILLGPLEGHTSWIKSIAFSPDGSRIISVGINGLVCTWDAQQRSLTSTSTDAPSDRITCAKFSTMRSRPTWFKWVNHI